jgi:hypothetical protein
MESRNYMPLETPNVMVLPMNRINSLARSGCALIALLAITLCFARQQSVIESGTPIKDGKPCFKIPILLKEHEQMGGKFATLFVDLPVDIYWNQSRFISERSAFENVRQLFHRIRIPAFTDALAGKTLRIDSLSSREALAAGLGYAEISQRPGRLARLAESSFNRAIVVGTSGEGHRDAQYAKIALATDLPGKNQQYKLKMLWQAINSCTKTEMDVKYAAYIDLLWWYLEHGTEKQTRSISRQIVRTFKTYADYTGYEWAACFVDGA